MYISVYIKNINFDEKKLIVLGKGNKERVVYLTNETIKSLKLYLKIRKDKNETLFLNNKNNRIAPGGIRWILNNISEKTGIENVHSYYFRRTLATDLLNKGMAIQDVSKILGHANVTITQIYYYHTDKKVESEFRKFI